MDINKVYFKAKDKNEARVIVELLRINSDEEPWSDDSYDIATKEGRGIALYLGGPCHGDFKEEGFTEADPIALFRFAMNGFKKPYEVAPDGKQIVTMEQREEFEYPTDCEVMWCCESGDWIVSQNDIAWNPSERQDECKAFAVPASYTFAKPEKQITVNGKEYSESTIANALREYTK